MFHPDLQFDAPAGNSLLAELGIRPGVVRELAADDRAMRCPDRGAVFPAYGFASLAPDPASGMAFQDAAAADSRHPSSSLPPA